MSIGFYSFGEGELDAAAMDIAVIGALTGHRWGRRCPFAYPGQRAFLLSAGKQECFFARTKQGQASVLDRNLGEGKKEHV